MTAVNIPRRMARSLRMVHLRLHGRRGLPLAVVWMLLLALAAGPVRGADDNSRPERLTTKDGWPISITYYESAQRKNAPVVVLLHGESGNRLTWEGDGGLAGMLQKEGYAVITVDLRKHGQSKAAGGRTPSRRGGRPSPIDYRNMVLQDLEAVKRFIFQEHQNEKLNMRKMAIVAADMSAPIAVNYALRDWMKKPYDDAPTLSARTPRGQDVRALVLLSPEDRVAGTSVGKPLLTLRQPALNIAFLIGVGKRDNRDRGAANKIYEQLTAIQGNDQRVFLQEYPGKLRGTSLLRKGLRVEKDVLFFLNKYLKPLPDAWVDRSSRLTR